MGAIRNRKNIYELLDWLKIADIVVPVLSARALRSESGHAID